MSPLTALLVGIAAGAHTATWGMYKDAIHEGFTYRKYLRSVFVGGLASLGVWWWAALPTGRASSIILLFGMVYAIERALVEFYKTFLREEDQSKYTIPMQFAVRGVVVQSRPARWLAGAAAVALVSILAWLIASMGPLGAGLAPWALVLMSGSAFGWISALGGAWKDAPIEGFSTLKFFRSPAIAAAYALVLSGFTHGYTVPALGAIGYTIATLETYKTFFFPNRPRGKFAGKPIRHPDLLAFRQRFVPLYAALWAAILVFYALALMEPHAGGPAIGEGASRADRDCVVA